MSKLLELVKVQCVACGEEFETARCNLGYGNEYCDPCNDEIADSYSDDMFESALWVKAGPR